MFITRLCSSSEKSHVTFQVPIEKRPKELTEHELLSMSWRLNWKSSSRIVTLSLSLVPTPRFEEKLGNVWIDIKKLTSNKNGTIINRTSKFAERPILLKKSNSYTVNVIAWEERMQESYIAPPNFSLEVEFYLLNTTVEIIEEVKVPSCTALHDFSQLLVFDKNKCESKFCDMTLVVKQTQEETDTQTEFYAHKAILAIRCPVFAAMFSHNMKETATNTITLDDIEPDILKELLTYIYTGQCPNIRTYAASLLHHAEKYELSHLKALCERYLSYDLQIDNAAKILILADTYKAEQLKRNALLFIEEHGDEVELTEDWEDVTKSIDLLRDLVSTRYRKKRKIQ